jgi:AraC-like DNA-binding protein
MSIADIAHTIGFSDARGFRRAFKRWTGALPNTQRTT